MQAILITLFTRVFSRSHLPRVFDDPPRRIENDGVTLARREGPLDDSSRAGVEWVELVALSASRPFDPDDEGWRRGRPDECSEGEEGVGEIDGLSRPFGDGSKGYSVGVGVGSSTREENEETEEVVAKDRHGEVVKG